MVTNFFPRSEKAKWGFACNQSVDGSLWAGKGYECPLASQIGSETAEAVAQALEAKRRNRCGRFWINLGTRTLTMQVGASFQNKVDQTRF